MSNTTKPGYLVIKLTDNTIERAQKHVKDWNTAPGVPVLAAEVRISYKGDEVEMTMQEFLRKVGLVPCPTCDNTGEVVVREPVYPGEAPTANTKMTACPDCVMTGVEY